MGSVGNTYKHTRISQTQVETTNKRDNHFETLEKVVVVVVMTEQVRNQDDQRHYKTEKVK